MRREGGLGLLDASRLLLKLSSKGLGAEFFLVALFHHLKRMVISRSQGRSQVCAAHSLTKDLRGI